MKQTFECGARCRQLRRTPSGQGLGIPLQLLTNERIKRYNKHEFNRGDIFLLFASHHVDFQSVKQAAIINTFLKPTVLPILGLVKKYT